MLFIDTAARRASTLELTQQRLGVDCGEQNETSVTLRVDGPCTYAVLNGTRCVKEATSCDLLAGWEVLVAQGEQTNQTSSQCFSTVAELGPIGACFGPGQRLASLSYAGAGVELVAVGPTLHVAPPASGYVFPAFLCKCGSAVPEEEAVAAAGVRRAAGGGLPTQLVAAVSETTASEESILILDLARDRATLWRASEQPLGFNCSAEDGAAAYVLQLNSSCASLVHAGRPCSAAAATASPCAHVQAWRLFAAVETEESDLERCLSVKAALGPATLCLAGPRLLNYTYAGAASAFVFGDVIADFAAPESVFPFVPFDVCPCAV